MLIPQKQTSCDVLILGASMAGSCLARHLKLKHPQLNVTVIDKKKEFDYGIGESMLEIFWDYAAKDLLLGPYLDNNHLLKHGLRFFFDNEEKNLSLEQMSEMGRGWTDAIPAHQIDRKKFDEDIAKLNQKIGIQVLLGCDAKEINLDKENGHKVLTSQGEFTCKWLVDATGLNSLLGRKLDLIKPIEEHKISTRWVRVKGINIIDHMGSDAWREKVHYNSRFLSTTHFMYKNYWFWMIPLEEDLYSIGLVWKNEEVDLTLKSSEDFIKFICSHKALADVLGDSYEILDYHGLKNMSRMANQFYSEDRWFLTGMSAAFLDPLFSSGSAFLSDANRMIVDLIETDMANDKRTLHNKVCTYNEHSRWWLKNFLLHITGNYHGSYDLLRQLFEPLLMDYFGLILPVSMSHQWGYDPSIDYVDANALRCMKDDMLANGAAMKVHKICDELAEFLETKEGLYTRNSNQFFDLKITKTYNRHSLSRGKTLSPDAIKELHMEMLQLSLTMALKRMALSDGRMFPEEQLPQAMEDYLINGKSLHDVYHAHAEPLRNEQFYDMENAYINKAECVSV